MAELAQSVISNEVALISNNISARIDLHGAWLTRLTYGNLDLLYPQQKVMIDGAEKLRGGSHICLPFFGPPKDTSEAQHGFGRNVLWEKTAVRDNSLELSLKVSPELLQTLEASQPGAKQYEGLSAKLTLELSETPHPKFSQSLTLINNCTDGRAMAVAPGFHPYFALTASRPLTEVSLLGLPSKPSNYSYSGDELKAAQQEEFTGSLTAQLGDRVGVKISGTNTRNVTVWSDFPSYICIEPTALGAVYGKTRKHQPITLSPGESHTISMKAEWIFDLTED